MRHVPPFSEVPNNLQTKYPPVNYKTAIHGASLLAKNCHSFSNREALVESLQQHIRVDSLSMCLHNADPPPGVVDLANKTQSMRAYLFHLAFENQCEDDYITEKLWGALSSGTLPVYLGSRNIYHHLPDHMKHSIINVHDFDSYQDLGEYLVRVANNQTLYESYHAWRQKPLPLKFVEKYNFTRTNPKCRTCRWAFAKKYGLGWNHSSQTLEELSLSRKLCWMEKPKTEQKDSTDRELHNHHNTGNMALVTHPFRESWLIVPAATNNKTNDNNNNEPQERIPQNNNISITSTSTTRETCEMNSTMILKSFLSSSVHRIIQYHGGIIDMIVLVMQDDDSSEQQQESSSLQNYQYVLQVDMISSFMMTATTSVKQHAKPLASGDGHNKNHLNNITFHQFGRRESFIQNEVSRMTILTDWDVPITHTETTGILQIPINIISSTNKNTIELGDYHYNNNNNNNNKPETRAGAIRRKSYIRRRLRFIVENVDTFYKGGHSELYYYFGALMKNDFFNPIEKIRIVVEENEEEEAVVL